MQVTTTLKYLKISPKKAKFLARTIQKIPPKKALERLSFAKEKGAIIFSKAIKQALADATNNFKLNEKDLIFKSIEANIGPHLKRWQPVARGMAHQIKKETTHIKIVLEEVKPKSEARNSKQNQITKIQKKEENKSI